jgi:predicted nucleic acid-binding protein
VASLVDTNVLVYQFDPRSVAKQQVAREVLRRGLADEDEEALIVPHQAIVEFVAAVTRVRPELGNAPLLTPQEARLEAEALMAQFPVLYPTSDVLTTALRGAAAYQLSWFDAHLWAYAEVHGVPEILSEDFEHGRRYGAVRVRDPFLVAADRAHELPALYEPEAPG